jgi:single-strand DNA-binding protein
MDNTVTLVGTVTRDPELRYTPSGQTVATFGLAVNRRWQNRQTQEWEEQVSFFDVKSWAGLAENVAESVQRGTRVIVTGRLEQRSWETDNGDKRSKVEVVADEVAPSLRWATATVQKIERQAGGNAGGASQGGTSQGGSNQGGGGSRPAANEPNSYSDEEPF